MKANSGSCEKNTLTTSLISAYEEMTQKWGATCSSRSATEFDGCILHVLGYLSCKTSIPQLMCDEIVVNGAIDFVDRGKASKASRKATDEIKIGAFY